MKRNLMFLFVLLVAFPTLTFSQMQSGSPAQARIQKEVRHELLMLPYFGVFDNIEYRVDGETVTLLGDVTRPTLKSDAENVVKRIEGVQQVVNDRGLTPVSDGRPTALGPVSRHLRLPGPGEICLGRTEAYPHHCQERPCNSGGSCRQRGGQEPRRCPRQHGPRNLFRD
jgi:BON domain